MTLKIKETSIEKVIPYARNPRKNEAAITKVAASLAEFGWQQPIVVDKDMVIIAGHTRFAAAQRLQMETVPVLVAEHLTDSQVKAYRIADNRVHQEADWDIDLLKLEFADLKSEDFDLAKTGFDEDELNDILAEAVKEGLVDDDSVPDVPEEPKTKLGDIYQLGRHRLMCGDSTSIDAVEKLMDGQKADLTFTSPPYNANTKAGDGDIFTSKKSKKLYGEGYSDNLQSSQYVDFATSVLENCFLVTDGFIFWNVSYNANSRFEYIQQISNRLPNLIEQICWKKTSTIPFKGSLMRDWEPIYLFSTNGNLLGLDEVVSNFWQVSNTNSQTENHKACFPVELPEKGIKLIKQKTGIIFDPFGGSGTTMIACEKLGRTNFTMELDPKYCDVIVKRWEDFTGKKAELVNGSDLSS